MLKIFFFISIALIAGMMSPEADKYAAMRDKMVKDQIFERGISDNTILKAFRKVPRHLFVPENLVNEAYNDSPLPIGYGQTISQPYIVAYMTEVAKPTSGDKVLEIGTGSGYQAAIMAELVNTVFSIEIIPELAKESGERLRKLGYKNIKVKYGDGYLGWSENAPFDIIIVTAAAESIPRPLIDQLAEGGRLIIPVGPQHDIQYLTLAVKKNGKIENKRLTAVSFVPFKRL